MQCVALRRHCLSVAVATRSPIAARSMCVAARLPHAELCAGVQQRAHWPAHKPICGKAKQPSQTQEATSAPTSPSTDAAHTADTDQLQQAIRSLHIDHDTIKQKLLHQQAASGLELPASVDQLPHASPTQLHTQTATAQCSASTAARPELHQRSSGRCPSSASHPISGPEQAVGAGELSAEPVAPVRCAVCGSPDFLSQCSRCKLISYCSPEHQRSHWPVHKAQCRRAQQQATIKSSQPTSSSSSGFKFPAVANSAPQQSSTSISSITPNRSGTPTSSSSALHTAALQLPDKPTLDTNGLPAFPMAAATSTGMLQRARPGAANPSADQWQDPTPPAVSGRWADSLCGAQVFRRKFSGIQALRKAQASVANGLPVIFSGAAKQLLHGVESQLNSVEALDAHLANTDVTVLQAAPKVVAGGSAGGALSALGAGEATVHLLFRAVIV